MHRTAKTKLALKWIKPCKHNICDLQIISYFIMHNRLDVPTVFYVCFVFSFLFASMDKTFGLTCEVVPHIHM